MLLQCVRPYCQSHMNYRSETITVCLFLLLLVVHFVLVQVYHVLLALKPSLLILRSSSLVEFIHLALFPFLLHPQSHRPSLRCFQDCPSRPGLFSSRPSRTICLGRCHMTSAPPCFHHPCSQAPVLLLLLHPDSSGYRDLLALSGRSPPRFRL